MIKTKIIRCAIYTRKSTEEGLEQEFNSLDAQREASESYIKSQKHEGWEVIATRYDDGGYSGGNMERPALRQLLADIAFRKIDVVVVYKVDRLSRALGDFAKMVEIFDQHGVSFVSVTQAFNTTTSMGRLTLNVLLSFAQFEREVTGERIRDKFAASKKKGMWMGGRQPLGYDVVERKLIVNEKEGAIIRFIFEHYANNSAGEPLYKLLDVLKAEGHRNKSYATQKGGMVVGQNFTINQIYSILNNPLYLGKMKHKLELYNGEHTAIIDEDLWNRVHSKMDKKQFVRQPQKQSERPKLVGKLYDYLGHRLSPTYSYKYSSNGRYKMRYYINREISTKGKTTSEFKRIRAELIDDVILAEINNLQEVLLKGITKSDNTELSSALMKPIRKMIATPIEHVAMVILFPQHMELSLQFDNGASLSETSLNDIQKMLPSYETKVTISPESKVIITCNIKAQYKRTGGQLHIITENGTTQTDAAYHYPDDKTFIFLAKSFYWNRQIDEGLRTSIKEIAVANNHNSEYVKKALKQRFLCPEIIECITSNQSGLQISVENLVQCNHWDWRNQKQALIPGS